MVDKSTSVPFVFIKIFSALFILIDEGGYQVAYYVVYMFDASLGEINIDEPSNILMKTANTEVDLLQINNKGLKQVIFVVTTVNRFRQESAVVDKVMYMY